MPKNDPLKNEELLASHERSRVYSRVKQGAVLRSGAGLFVLAFVTAGYLIGLMKLQHIVGVGASVLFLIVVSLPILVTLKRSSSRKVYEVISILNNFCEVVGYTAIIYFLGGTRAFFITPIYAILIAYLGVITPPRFLFITAGFATIFLSLVVALEYYGYLPHMDPFSTTPVLPGPAQVIVVLATSCLLFVIAFITSIMGKELKISRARQQEQYLELEKKAQVIEQADRELRQAHQVLEERVKERTTELKEANDHLEEEIREHRQSQAQLAEARSLLRAAIEQTPAGILIADAPDVKIRLANPAALGIQGDSAGPLTEIS
ncbi:MAG: hypothetical protein C0407_17090, partial [Desulfobacca sp.]|nr:hypothetical protein [Desulfobacca sp.]